MFQLAAVARIGDLARDAAAFGRVGHQHAIAAGQGQVGSQGRAFVAALFLVDLDQHDLAALDHLLDLIAARQEGVRQTDFVLRVVLVVVITIVVANVADFVVAIGFGQLVVFIAIIVIAIAVFALVCVVVLRFEQCVIGQINDDFVFIVLIGGLYGLITRLTLGVGLAAAR